MGPNEVDVKDLQSLPNASKKDGAAPAIQQYGKTPKKQVHLLAFADFGHILLSQFVVSSETGHMLAAHCLLQPWVLPRTS